MNNLVNITGEFSIDELKKIISNAEILLKQPRYEIHKVYSNKNPKFKYKYIHINKIVDETEYLVMDIGWIDSVVEKISIGSKIYSEKDIEKLRTEEEIDNQKGIIV